MPAQRKRIGPGIVIAMAFLLTLGATYASADTTLTLATNNGGFGNPPGPYGTVTVHLVSSTEATITFTDNQVGTNVYLFGDGGTVGFNANGAVTVQSIVGSNSRTDSGFGAFTPGPFTDGGSGNEDGFGSFSNTINSFDGYQHSSTQVIVDITKNSGSWASSDDVLTGNSGNFRAAAHIFLGVDNGNGTISNTGMTGFVHNGDSGGNETGSVPEPTSIALFGSMLVGVTKLIRKKAQS